MATIYHKGETPLHSAAAKGCLYTMIYYMALNKENINTRDQNGWTPLHNAVLEEHLEIVQYLIDEGANPNIPDTDGWIPLHYAAAEGYFNIVRYLVEVARSNITIGDKDCWYPINYAIAGGHIEVANYLMNRGFELKEKIEFSK